MQSSRRKDRNPGSASAQAEIPSFYRSGRAKKFAPALIDTFRKIIYRYYEAHGRDLPWRKTRNPYRILVSEIMLQQTQVERVLGKYTEFIHEFPDFRTLSGAQLTKILLAWQGLGYNRRALALKEIAEAVVHSFKGRLPSEVEVLTTLPGIGKTTASAIAAFAFDRPTVFIETNIRRVFIHFFFHDRNNIIDAEIVPLVEKTLDTSDPRSWYYALMDYGVMLKKELPNPNRRSAHYQRQSKFEGSNRQLRGRILRTMLKEPDDSVQALARKLEAPTDRVRSNLVQLETEGFLKKRGKRYTIL